MMTSNTGGAKSDEGRGRTENSKKAHVETLSSSLSKVCAFGGHVASCRGSYGVKSLQSGHTDTTQHCELP